MKLRKLLSLALALLLVMSLATTAFAAEAAPVKEAYLTKTFVSNVEKAWTFVFTATQVIDSGTDAYMDDPVACTIANIELGNKADVVEYGQSKLVFGGFTAAGVYKYTVKETAQTATGQGESLTCSQAEYEVYVYVEETAGEGGTKTYSIAAITVFQSKDQNGAVKNPAVKVDASNPTDSQDNGFNFHNIYVYEAGVGEDPTTTPENGSLTVSKTVQAADGTAKDNETTEFTFTATFDFPHDDLGANSLGGIQVAVGSEAATSFTSGSTFTLKDGQSAKFTDIPVGTKVTIVENGTAKYKGSAEITMNGAKEANPTVASGYGTALTISEKILGKGTNTVAVTNEHVYIPTTGVILNVLPFVLMMALAVSALFVMTYFKRRRNA